MKKTKQNVIVGALVGSAGIFITKLIGLLYTVPFSALVGDGNLAYYGYGYNVYSSLLNITMAGFPFAIAALVSKYMMLKNYEAVQAIKRLSFYVMAVFGFICMVALFAFAGPIAVYMTKTMPETAHITKTVLRIISLALFVVPVLGVYRGYLQGLKELNQYAFNQVLEQLARVIIMLAGGYIAIYMFQAERIFGVYFAMFSTSIAALLATLHMYVLQKRVVPKELKQNFQIDPYKMKQLFRELLKYAMPFMVVAFLGNSYGLIDMLVVQRCLVQYGIEPETAKVIYGFISVTVNKLTSIPMVVAPGFSLSIIPYITTSYIANDMKTVAKSITDCLAAAIFLVLPLSLVLLSLGTPIYAVMYGGENMLLGGSVLSWYSLDGLTSALAPVVTAIMMALSLRYANVKNILLGVIVKAVSVVPLILLLGYPGALLSSVLGTLTSITLNLRSVHQAVPVQYRKLLQLTSKIFLCLCSTQLVFMLFSFLGLKVYDVSRMQGFLELAVIGIGGAAAYFATAFYLHIPQTIFHKSTDELLAVVQRLIRRKRA